MFINQCKHSKVGSKLLRLVLNATRRHALWLAIALLVGLAIGAAGTAVAHPRYQATTRLFVSTNAAASATDLNQGGDFSQQIVKSYADVASSAYVLDPVIQNLQLGVTSDDLADDVVATAPLNTSVVNVTVTDLEPKRAARIANAIAEQLKSAVHVLTPATGSGQALVTVTQIQPARPPSSQSSPNLVLNLILGGLVALAIGGVVVVLRDLLDTRIRTAADIAGLTPLPLLGTTPFDTEAQNRSLIMAVEANSSQGESYRTLRTNLRFLNVDVDARVLTTTSAVESEGKSTTVGNLAHAIAAANLRVLLVDADLRRPRIGTYFSIDGSIGLTDVLVSSVTVDDAIQNIGDSSLWVLPSGSTPPNPSELLQSERMVNFLAEMRERFDYVLLDAPPILPVADGAILAKLSDGALFIVAAGRSRRTQVRAALDNLRQVNAHVLGIVMTMARANARGGYGYGYGYGYGSGSALSADAKA